MIRVFLHVAGMNHYREIVAELSGMINGSGLYDAAELTAVTVGTCDLSGLFGERWQTRGGGPLERFEFPTLRHLHAIAQTHPEDSFLYLHTKGASQPARRASRDAWRRYMARCVITDWRQCVDLLGDHDTVGTEIRQPPKHANMHYAGNFWWARGDYLSRLPQPVPKFVWKGERYAAETWLLDSGINARWFSFHDFDFPFWNRVIGEERYGTQSPNGIRGTSAQGIPEEVQASPRP